MILTTNITMNWLHGFEKKETFFLGYKFKEDDLLEEDSRLLTYHRILEASKYAFAGRVEMGDEDFVEGMDEVNFSNKLIWNNKLGARNIPWNTVVNLKQ